MARLLSKPFSPLRAPAAIPMRISVLNSASAVVAPPNSYFSGFASESVQPSTHEVEFTGLSKR